MKLKYIQVTRDPEELKALRLMFRVGAFDADIRNVLLDTQFFIQFRRDHALICHVIG